jgi:hypothetical protein
VTVNVQYPQDYIDEPDPREEEWRLDALEDEAWSARIQEAVAGHVAESYGFAKRAHREALLEAANVSPRQRGPKRRRRIYAKGVK